MNWGTSKTQVNGYDWRSERTEMPFEKFYHTEDLVHAILPVS